MQISRCRIYGSTKHIENEHTICDPSRPQECPPRCVNCHGPHPVDSMQCLTRFRNDNKLPSKSEIAQIRKISSASKLRLKNAYCVVISASTSATNKNQTLPILSTPHTVRKLFTESPCNTRGIFAVLSTPNGSRSNSPSAMHS